MQDGNEAMGQVFFIRGTKMTGGDHFQIEGAKQETNNLVLNSFLKQFYDSAATIPKLILIPHEIEDQEKLVKWLSIKRGAVVEIRIPKRGNKQRLVKMATENAKEAMQMARTKWMTDNDKTRGALEELQNVLNLRTPPHRIECYDISNTQGSNSVASMGVVLDAQPVAKEYRRFKIKTVHGANDYASMSEILERRFKRFRKEAEIQGNVAIELPQSPNAIDGQRHSSTATNDLGWNARPDLVVVDGGKGQLSSAHDVLRNLGLDDVPVAGLAKRNEELFVVDTKEPIRLNRHSQGLYLLQRIRDEAHRFAITYHRNVRSRHTIKSALDSVPGIGPKRKKA